MADLVHMIQQQLCSLVCQYSGRDIHRLQLGKNIRFEEHLHNSILFFRIDNAQPFQFRKTVFGEERLEYSQITLKSVVFHSYIKDQLFKVREVGSQNVLHHRIGQAEKAAAKLVAEKTKKGYVETREEVAKEMKVEAKKYALSYDEAEEGVNLMDRILKDKKLPSLRQITIGCWGYDGEDCSAIADGIVANKEKFAHLEGLFWGDMDSEEQEISWIEQVDLGPVLDVMPLLNNLKIKGTNNLSIGKKPRPNLKSLEIISGGLFDRREILYLCLSVCSQLAIVHNNIGSPNIDAPELLRLKVLKYKYSFHSMSV